MHTAGQLNASETIERASEAKREAAKQPRKRQEIHPSLRALPDYPE
ncbi:MAG: hypothetical protein ACO1OG_04840 [Devosia sp.]